MFCCAIVGCSSKVPRITSFHGIPLAPGVVCATPDCTSYNVRPHVRIRSTYGIGCLGNVPPGSVPDPHTPPESFRLADVGRRGVPALSPAERRLVARIERYTADRPTLRFARVDATTANGFIVFDALDGPCGTSRPYEVLNGSCNEFYEPGENPYHTMPAPGCFPQKRPWMQRA